MRRSSSNSLCATAAISAALVLGFTPALAQEVAPSIVLPQAAPAPQPAPSIVLPPAASAPEPAAAEPPVAEPVAATEPAPKAEPADRPAPRRAEAPAAEPVATPEAATPVAPMPMNMPVAAQPEAPAAVTPQPDSVRGEIEVPDGIIVASILGVIGLGLAGFVATRRRQREDDVQDTPYETQPAHVAEAPTTSIPDELAVRAEGHAPAAASTTIAAPPLPSGPLASGPLPSGDERERLLDRMVAAQPDEANPFTSAKARRKRARIILQARESEQGQQSSAPFDWRTYRSPASSDLAPPPMVDA